MLNCMYYTENCKRNNLCMYIQQVDTGKRLTASEVFEELKDLSVDVNAKLPWES